MGEYRNSHFYTGVDIVKSEDTSIYTALSEYEEELFLGDNLT